MNAYKNSGGKEVNGEIAYGTLLLIVLLGAALRLYKLDFQSLWTDEIMATFVAKNDLLTLISKHEENPPLSYFLTHFVLFVQDSDFMVRLPAAIFGVLSLVYIYRLGRVLYGVHEGLIAAFLMAVSLYHVTYSQEGRPYSALVFFSLASFYYLWQVLKNNEQRSWKAFVIMASLNLYNSFFAMFVLLAEALTVAIFLFKNTFSRPDGPLFTKTQKKLLSHVLISFGIIVLLFLPLVTRLLRASQQSIAGGALEFNLLYFKNLICRYGAGNGLPFYLYLFLFIFGIKSSLKHQKKELLSLLLLLVLPFAILFNMELKHFFHIRYVIFTLPIFLIIVARGLTGIADHDVTRQILGRVFSAGNTRVVCSVTLVAVLGFMAITPLRYYYSATSRLGDWKGIAEYICKHASPDITILIESEAVVPLVGYYVNKTRSDVILDSVRGSAKQLLERCQHENVWYIDASPVFDHIVNHIFRKKIVFTSPAFKQLGERELIDWENSWFSAANIRRYFPTLYYDNVVSSPDAWIVSINGKKFYETWLEETLSIARSEYSSGSGDVNEEILKDLIYRYYLEKFYLDCGITVAEYEVKETIRDFQNCVKNNPYTFSLPLTDILRCYGSSLEALENEIRVRLGLMKYLVNNLNDKCLDRYFLENKYAYTGEMVRASHIFIDTTRLNTEEELDTALEKANKIRKKLVNGADFANMAKMHSDCPSKVVGGDLGCFSLRNVRGVAKEFTQNLFKLKVGEVSPPVKTEFGYHLITLTEKIARKVIAFEDVRKLLREDYLEDQYKELRKKLLQRLNLVINKHPPHRSPSVSLPLRLHPKGTASEGL